MIFFLSALLALAQELLKRFFFPEIIFFEPALLALALARARSLAPLPFFCLILAPPNAAPAPSLPVLCVSP